MRLIHTFKNVDEAKALSAFLTEKDISNRVETEVNKDWGSEEYGDLICKLWIHEEDDLNDARQWLNAFEKNPKDPQFTLQGTHPAPPPLPPPSQPIQTGPRQAGTPVTMAVLMVCALLFLMGQFLSPALQPLPNGIPYVPVFGSPIKKTLFYDYPEAYQIIEQIADTYGKESFQDLSKLPPEGKLLLKKFVHTPYWNGAYPLVVNALTDQENVSAPLFEKISQGEFWRLFTPALLHANLLHIFFNMIWLLVLGKQMEVRLGAFRFIFFMLLAGIFSNTAQYLMSGSNFIGFSGVVCAMIAFIWVRQRKAPWEGYHIQQATFVFISVFVLAMAFLGFVSFSLEISNRAPLTASIANTSHLAGALAGFLLAHTRLFSKPTS